MKIDFCDICLSNGKLSKTTFKGETAIRKGFNNLKSHRLSICSSSSCKSVWKEINNNKIEVANLLNRAEEQGRLLK